MEDEEAELAARKGKEAEVSSNQLASALSKAISDTEREERERREKQFEEAVVVWQRDVRGRFLAHLKVLYWEALEVGRATKEIVETLVECTDIALDSLDKPLGDWRALETRMLD